MKIHAILIPFFVASSLFASQEKTLEQKKLREVTSSITIDPYGKFVKTYKGTDHINGLELQTAISCYYTKSGFKAEKASTTLNPEVTQDNLKTFIELYAHIIWGHHIHMVKPLQEYDEVASKTKKSKFLQNYLTQNDSYKDDEHETNLSSKEDNETTCKVIKTTKDSTNLMLSLDSVNIDKNLMYSYSFTADPKEALKNFATILSHQQFSLYRANEKYLEIVGRLLEDRGIYSDVRLSWKISTGHIFSLDSEKKQKNEEINNNQSSSSAGS